MSETIMCVSVTSSSIATAARPEAAKLSCEVSICSCEVSTLSCGAAAPVAAPPAALASHVAHRSYWHISHRSLRVPFFPFSTTKVPKCPKERPHLAQYHLPFFVSRDSVCPRSHLKLDKGGEGMLDAIDGPDAFGVPKDAFGVPKDAFDVPKGAFGVPGENATIGAGACVDAGPFGCGAAWPSCTVRSGARGPAQYVPMTTAWSRSYGSSVTCSCGLKLSFLSLFTSDAKTASGAAVESTHDALMEMTKCPPTLRKYEALRATIRD